MSISKTLVALAGLAIAGSAFATQYTFTWKATAGSSAWASAGNWDVLPSTPPAEAWPGGNGRTDDIVIIQNGTNDPVYDYGTKPFASLTVNAGGDLMIDDTDDIMQVAGNIAIAGSVAMDGTLDTQANLTVQNGAVLTVNDGAEVEVSGQFALQDADGFRLGHNAELRLDSAELLIDASGGGELDAVIQNVGTGDIGIIRLDASELDVNHANSSLQILNIVVAGDGNVHGAGSLDNRGQLRPENGEMTLGSALDLTDIAGLRYQVEPGARLTFEKSESGLVGDFRIVDDSGDTSELEFANGVDVVTAGQVYLGVGSDKLDFCPAYFFYGTGASFVFDDPDGNPMSPACQ